MFSKVRVHFPLGKCMIILEKEDTQFLQATFALLLG